MRVLGIETSTERGSVAVTEGGRVLGALHHERPNAHAEALLPLIERLLAETGVSKASLERIAVGTGPGSFTGLRVGIALGEGLALGLGVPLVGVGSLEAMARGVRGRGRTCVAALDARRGELFLAAYSTRGDELLPPQAVPRDRTRGRIATLGDPSELVVVGAAGGELGGDLEWVRAPELDFPDARFVALLGAEREPSPASAEPIYVRGPGATLPNLPPSPLSDTNP